MRSNLELKLNDTWYGGQPAPWHLRQLVPVYKLGNRIDRWWKSRQQPTDLGNVFIIVVGNITVGGSGKTPLVIRLCQLLQQAGFRPGVISRGYGRKETKLRLVSPASDPSLAGDEPLLIAQRTGVPVLVGADRCEATRKLIKKEVNVVISDDGLQHYRLPRHLEICVIDGSRGFGNGLLLPAGPLREPLSRLADFDHVVVNGESTLLPEELETTPMNLAPGLLRSMESGQTWRLAQFAGCKANAVAGIGNPDRFFDLLRSARLNVQEHRFPDHYIFERSDFEAMDTSFPILMTEKDAVKCKTLGLKNAWALSVDAVLPSAWEQEILRQVSRGPGEEGESA